LKGLSYVWSPREGLSSPFVASPVASPARTTTYEVIIKQDCGRQRYDEVTVTVTDLQQAFDLGPPDTIGCRGKPLVLDAEVEEASYRWSTGSEAPRIRADQPGRYAVTVTTPACTATDEIDIRFSEGPGFSFEGDTTLCQGEELLLEVTGEPHSVRWEDGSSDASRRLARTGNYRVWASNACGMSEASVNVDIQPCGELYMPNAFSPNGDGINDRFVLFSNLDRELHILSLRIFDRWGNLIYEASGATPGAVSASWDGNFRGRPAPVGTYLFYVEWELPSGKKGMEAGMVKLMR
jgi:gliding motility-associated-like protein